MSRRRDFSCAEVVGGIEATELSVRLPGARGEIWAQPYGGAPAGGDVHYVATCGVSQLSKVVLADVSGHGAAVADAARIIHAALVDNLNEHDNGRLLSSINRAFVSRSPGAFHFTTMVASIYDSANRTLVYAYAGHPPLLLGRRSTGRFESLDYDHGVPIGVVDDVLYEQRHLALEVGDVLVYYTDALVEVPGPAGTWLGEDGLRRLLEEAGSLAPAVLKDAVLERVAARLNDDATLIILETV